MEKEVERINNIHAHVWHRARQQQQQQQIHQHGDIHIMQRINKRQQQSQPARNPSQQIAMVISTTTNDAYITCFVTS